MATWHQERKSTCDEKRCLFVSFFYFSTWSMWHLQVQNNRMNNENEQRVLRSMWESLTSSLKFICGVDTVEGMWKQWTLTRLWCVKCFWSPVLRLTWEDHGVWFGSHPSNVFFPPCALCFDLVFNFYLHILWWYGYQSWRLTRINLFALSVAKSHSSAVFINVFHCPFVSCRLYLLLNTVDGPAFLLFCFVHDAVLYIVL